MQQEMIESVMLCYYIQHYDKKNKKECQKYIFFIILSDAKKYINESKYWNFYKNNKKTKYFQRRNSWK